MPPSFVRLLHKGWETTTLRLDCHNETETVLAHEKAGTLKWLHRLRKNARLVLFGGSAGLQPCENSDKINGL